MSQGSCVRWPEGVWEQSCRCDGRRVREGQRTPDSEVPAHTPMRRSQHPRRTGATGMWQQLSRGSKTQSEVEVCEASAHALLGSRAVGEAARGGVRPPPLGGERPEPAEDWRPGWRRDPGRSVPPAPAYGTCWAKRSGSPETGHSLTHGQQGALGKFRGRGVPESV